MKPFYRFLLCVLCALLPCTFAGCGRQDVLSYQKKEIFVSGTFAYGGMTLSGSATISSPQDGKRQISITLREPDSLAGVTVESDGTVCRMKYRELTKEFPDGLTAMRQFARLFSIPNALYEKDGGVYRFRDGETVWELTLRDGMPQSIRMTEGGGAAALTVEEFRIS